MFLGCMCAFMMVLCHLTLAPIGLGSMAVFDYALSDPHMLLVLAEDLSSCDWLLRGEARAPVQT